MGMVSGSGGRRGSKVSSRSGRKERSPSSIGHKGSRVEPSHTADKFSTDRKKTNAKRTVKKVAKKAAKKK
jgi:hypothetical protein